MAFDIRATVTGTAESRVKAHEVARALRTLLASNGFTGVIEVREQGTTDAFVRDVVGPDEGAADR